MNYDVLRLKDAASSGPLALLDRVKASAANLPNDATLFGVFQGLFGLASNELYLVTCQETGAIDLDSDFDVREHVRLQPTVRPTRHTPCQREGIYVFRWFSVHPQDVDEIAALSDAAWQTFENSEYDTEVQGLFVEQAPLSDPCRMLLITWYSDLNAWQASRRPPESARDNFMRRHQLTLEALPVATRLVSASAEPVVPGGNNRFS